MNDLVSVVIPVYNCEKYIDETIESVLNQTYNNWELILVDDCSTDDSVKRIEKYLTDNRIKLVKLEKNSGAGIARNNGVKIAKGKYLCFLDGDDKWKNDKLKGQIAFMKKTNAEFSYTGYQFCDENCNPIGAIVKVPKTITYKQALKNTIISSIIVMFDLEKLTKDDIRMMDIRRGQDTVTWWNVLKKVDKAYGLNEVLSYYRRPKNTLSSNKFKSLKSTWRLYRDVEKLNIFYAIYCFCGYVINAIIKRI